MTSPIPTKKYPFQTFNIQLFLEENLVAETIAVADKITELSNQLREFQDYAEYLEGISRSATREREAYPLYTHDGRFNGPYTVDQPDVYQEVPHDNRVSEA